MSGTGAAGDGTDAARKRATLRTRHDDPAVVASAVRPDNTDAMETTVTGDRVVTRIERPTTGGLRSTVDDYVVNLRVAERVAATARGEAATAVDNRDAAAVDGTTDECERADEAAASDGPNDSDITTDDTHDT
jgi:hypothetical protein